jgi:hypothetical protein
LKTPETAGLVLHFSGGRCTNEKNSVEQGPSNWTPNIVLAMPTMIGAAVIARRIKYRNQPVERVTQPNWSRLDVWSFQRKTFLILANKDRRPGILFRKMMPPGTTSLISVPEFVELTIVSLPPMREARSRIPRNPKCPSFPVSTMAGSIPVPLSLTRRARSSAYRSSTSN